MLQIICYAMIFFGIIGTYFAAKDYEREYWNMRLKHDMCKESKGTCGFDCNNCRWG